MLKQPIIPIERASRAMVLKLMEIGILQAREDGLHVKENIPTADRKSE